MPHFSQCSEFKENYREKTFNLLAAIGDYPVHGSGTEYAQGASLGKGLSETCQ